MATDVIVQKIAKKEVLPHSTIIYQTDDGTIFYCSFISPYRLYVKWEDKEIDAVLPYERIYHLCALGESMYFTDATRKKIYKAVFSPTNGIIVSHLRDRLEGEDLASNFYRRVQHGKEYLYRLCDDPNTEGILHDVTAEELAHRGELRFLHRDKIIYKLQSNMQQPSVRRIRNNVIVVEGNNIKVYYTNDSSPFIHFICDDKTIYAFNIETLELLPPVQIRNVDEVWFIVGVHNGMISLVRKVLNESACSIITAPLPHGYYEMTNPMKTDTHQEKIEANGKKNLEEGNRETSGDTCHADNPFDYLVEQCCCSICSESFDSIKFIPRNLVCGHTFCEICLDNDNLRTKDAVKCPNCETVTHLRNGTDLPKNFPMISMAEQLMKSRVDPKVACKACNKKFPSSSVCLCNKEDCSMFNQLLCMNCAIDGGHVAHVVKYDVRLEKIREKLRDNVTNLRTKIEEKKISVLEKTKQLSEMFTVLEKNLSELKIPPQIVDQLKTIASEQDAEEYMEIVENLAKTIIDECDDLNETFDRAINSATRLTRE